MSDLGEGVVLGAEGDQPAALAVFGEEGCVEAVGFGGDGEIEVKSGEEIADFAVGFVLGVGEFGVFVDLLVSTFGWMKCRIPTLMLKSRRLGLAWSMDRETMSSFMLKLTWLSWDWTGLESPPYMSINHPSAQAELMPFNDLIRGGNVDARKAI